MRSSNDKARKSQPSANKPHPSSQPPNNSNSLNGASLQANPSTSPLRHNAPTNPTQPHIKVESHHNSTVLRDQQQSMLPSQPSTRRVLEKVDRTRPEEMELDGEDRVRSNVAMDLSVRPKQEEQSQSQVIIIPTIREPDQRSLLQFLDSSKCSIPQRKFNRAIHACQWYISHDDMSPVQFLNQLSPYVDLYHFKPTGLVGQTLVQNGIFLLAYAKYAANGDREEREHRILRLEERVKTDKEVFEKEYNRVLADVAVRMANDKEDRRRRKHEEGSEVKAEEGSQRRRKEPRKSNRRKNNATPKDKEKEKEDAPTKEPQGIIDKERVIENYGSRMTYKLIPNKNQLVAVRTSMRLQKKSFTNTDQIQQSSSKQHSNRKSKRTHPQPTNIMPKNQVVDIAWVKNHLNQVKIVDRPMEDWLFPLTPEDQELREFIQSQQLEEDSSIREITKEEVKEERGRSRGKTKHKRVDFDMKTDQDQSNEGSKSKISPIKIAIKVSPNKGQQKVSPSKQIKQVQPHKQISASKRVSAQKPKDKSPENVPSKSHDKQISNQKERHSSQRRKNAPSQQDLMEKEYPPAPPPSQESARKADKMQQDIVESVPIHRNPFNKRSGAQHRPASPDVMQVEQSVQIISRPHPPIAPKPTISNINIPTFSNLPPAPQPQPQQSTNRRLLQFHRTRHLYRPSPLTPDIEQIIDHNILNLNVYALVRLSIFARAQLGEEFGLVKLPGMFTARSSTVHRAFEAAQARANRITFANIPMNLEIRRELNDHRRMFVRARTRSQDNVRGFVEVTMGYQWIPIQVREKVNKIEQINNQKNIDKMEVDEMQQKQTKKRKSNRPDTVYKGTRSRLSLGITL